MALLLATPAVQAEQAVASDAFVDSVGVTVHLHNGHTQYFDNFPLVKRSLLTLGIRHIREGLIDTKLQVFYDRLNELGAAGIKGLYVTDPATSPFVLQQYPTRVKSSFEAYEGPNEYDKKPDWVNTLQRFVPVLYESAKMGAAPNAPVVGPSLTKTASFTQLGTLDRFMDYGNLHNYYAGRNPGSSGWGGANSQGHRFGSIPFSIEGIRNVSGNKPIWVTETGYTNDQKYANYVSEEVAAIYTPRLLLEHWNSGFPRTYLYELISSGHEDFGLLHADGSPKLVFGAVGSLLNLLADKGPAFNPGRLDYSIDGGSPNLHHLLLQKRNGTFYLALWIESSCWDPDKHVNLPVAPQNIVLHLNQPVSAIGTYQWQPGSDPAQGTLTAGSTIPLTVTDKLLVLQIAPAGTGKPVSSAAGRKRRN